jgi:hypothetical protein
MQTGCVEGSADRVCGRKCHGMCKPVQTGRVEGIADWEYKSQCRQEDSVDRACGRQCRFGRVEGSADRACGRQCRQGVWKAV